MKTPIFIPTSISPTEEQVEIQTSTFNTILIEANAGAAKTTTLALRMAESWRHGLPPEKCYALTFTDTAVDALRQSLKRLGLPIMIVNRFHIQTFEAFSVAILAKLEGYRVPQKLSSEELKPVVQQAIQNVANSENIRWRDELVIPPLTDNTSIEEFLRVMQRLKGSLKLDLEWYGGGLTPSVAEDMGESYSMLRFFFAYEKIRRGSNVDYPAFRGPYDGTYDLARMAHNNELIDDESYWPKDIRTLVVDEMHDMNWASYQVLRQFLKNGRTFFCGVGDEDQVIFSTFGADVRFMQDQISIDTKRKTQRYKLTPSFRFGKQLAEPITSLTQNTCLSYGESETNVEVTTYSTESTSSPSCEILIIENAISCKKRKRSQLAVLFRNPSQSVHIENALIQEKLPYATHGFDSYFLRPEVLLIRGLFAVASDNFDAVQDIRTRQKMVESLAFFCDVKLDIGDSEATQSEVIASAVKEIIIAPNLLRDYFNNHILKNATPFVVHRLKAAIKVIKTESGKDMFSSLLAALEANKIAADVIVEKHRREEVVKNLKALCSVAETFSTPFEFFKNLNDSEITQASEKKSAQITLADIAYVKGLEFDSVVIPYLENGIFPANAAPNRQEQNLFYVGCTRAKLNLSLYFHDTRPSPWLKSFKTPH